MDSASKAIIVAAGMFIGMLIISISMYMLTAFRDFYDDSMTQFEVQQISAFNSFFTQYPSTIKGYDVYNIVGKINEINADEDIDYFISCVNDIKRDEHFYFTENFTKDYNYQYFFDSDGVINKVEITKIET